MAAVVLAGRFRPILSCFQTRSSTYEPPTSANEVQAVRGLRNSSVIPPRKINPLQERHVNCALLEEGVTKYFCNRNPRNPELLGIAEKPKGFETTNKRVDYYHRFVFQVHNYLGRATGLNGGWWAEQPHPLMTSLQLVYNFY